MHDRLNFMLAQAATRSVPWPNRRKAWSASRKAGSTSYYLDLSLPDMPGIE